MRFSSAAGSVPFDHWSTRGLRVHVLIGHVAEILLVPRSSRIVASALGFVRAVGEVLDSRT